MMISLRFSLLMLVALILFCLASAGRKKNRQKFDVPVPLLNASDYEIYESETIELPCEFELMRRRKRTRISSVEWTHNGRPLTLSKRTDKDGNYLDRVIVLKTVLVVRNSVASDEGMYVCRAKNQFGTGFVYHRLYVTPGLPTEARNPGPPIWWPRSDVVARKGSHRAEEGTLVEIDCRVAGYPKPKVVFRFNGRELTGPNYHFHANGKFVIEKLPLRLLGNVTCEATNQYGKIHRTMHMEPYRDKQAVMIHDGFPRNITVLEYSDAKFWCDFRIPREAPGNIAWLRQDDWIRIEAEMNEAIEKGVRYKAPQFIKHVKQTSNHTLDSFLELKNVSKADAGGYVCFVYEQSKPNEFKTSVGYLNVLDDEEWKLWIERSTPKPDGVVASTPTSHTSTLIGWTVGGGIFGLCVILLLFLFVWVCKRVKDGPSTMKRPIRVFIKDNEMYSSQSATTPLMCDVKIGERPVPVHRDKAPNFPFVFQYKDARWEIPRKRVEVVGVLGEGAFGLVRRGVLTSTEGKKKECAIKMLKDGSCETDVKALVQEMEMLKVIGRHQNVVSLLGCCTQDGPLMVITECAELGNLRDYLKQYRDRALFATLSRPRTRNSSQRSPRTPDAELPLALKASITEESGDALEVLEEVSSPTEPSTSTVKKKPALTLSTLTPNGMVKTGNALHSIQEIEPTFPQPSPTQSDAPSAPCTPLQSVFTFESEQPFDDDDDDDQLTNRHLLSFAYQVARGMEHLHSKNCIHRDLAARNVLVTERRVLKICDFGLTRITDDYYRKTTEGRVPWKWMAMESLLEQRYTQKTDVWSYAVLLWEIYTLGGTPYHSIPPEHLYTFLKQGNRLDNPRYATPDIYELMLNCMSENPDERQSFYDIAELLDEKLSLETESEYVVPLTGDDRLPPMTPTQAPASHQMYANSPNSSGYIKSFALAKPLCSPPQRAECGDDTSSGGKNSQNGSKRNSKVSLTNSGEREKMTAV